MDGGRKYVEEEAGCLSGEVCQSFIFQRDKDHSSEHARQQCSSPAESLIKRGLPPRSDILHASNASQTLSLPLLPMQLLNYRPSP